MSIPPKSFELYGTGIAFGGLPFNNRVGSTALAGNLRATHMGLPLSLIGPSDTAAIAGTVSETIVVESTMAGLSTEIFGPILADILVEPTMEGISTELFGPILAAIDIESTMEGLSTEIFGPLVSPITIDSALEGTYSFPDAQAIIDSAITVISSLSGTAHRPYKLDVGKVIDVRAAGGDMVVLGKALVPPVSDQDGDHEPMEGAIRFHPTETAPQVFRDGAWVNIGASAAPPLTFPNITAQQLLARTQVGVGDPHGIDVGAGLVLAGQTLRGTLCGPFVVSNTHSGTFTNSQRVPLGIVPFSFSASVDSSYVVAMTAASANTVLTLKRKTKSGTVETVGTMTWTTGATIAQLDFSITALSGHDLLFVEAPASADATLADLSFVIRCSGDIPIPVPTGPVMFGVGGFRTKATPVIATYEKTYFGSRQNDHTSVTLGTVSWVQDKNTKQLNSWITDPATMWPHGNMDGPYYFSEATHNITTTTQSAGMFEPQTLFQFDNLRKGLSLVSNGPPWQPAGTAAFDGKFVVPAASIPLGAPTEGGALVRNAGIAAGQDYFVNTPSLPVGTNMTLDQAKPAKIWYNMDIIATWPTTGFPRHVRQYYGYIGGTTVASSTTTTETMSGFFYQHTENYFFDELTPVYSPAPTITTTWDWATEESNKWVEIYDMVMSPDGAITYVGGRCAPSALTSDYAVEHRAYIGAFNTTTGAPIWQTTLDPSTVGGRVQTLRIEDDKLRLVLSLQQSSNDIYAGWAELDIATGSLIGTPTTAQPNCPILDGVTIGTHRYVVTFEDPVSRTYLMKFDANGTLLWSRVVRDNSDWGEMTFFRIEAMPNGDVVVVGQWWEDPVHANWATGVYRFDSSGAIVWQLAYGDPEWTAGLQRFVVDVDGHILSDGTMVVVDYYRTFDFTLVDRDQHDKCHRYVTKVDLTTGAIISQRLISGEFIKAWTDKSISAANDDYTVIVSDWYVIVLTAAGFIADVYELNFYHDRDWKNSIPPINIVSVRIVGETIFLALNLRKSMLDGREDQAMVIPLPIDMGDDYFINFSNYMYATRVVNHTLTSSPGSPTFGPITDGRVAPYYVTIRAENPISFAVGSATLTAGTAAEVPTIYNATKSSSYPVSAAGNYWLWSLVQQNQNLVAIEFYMDVAWHQTACRDTAGNIYICGTIDAFAGSSQDRNFIIKLASNGTLIWHKHYHTAKLDTYRALIHNGVLYVLLSDGQLLRFDADTGAIQSAMRYLVSSSNETMINVGSTIYTAHYASAVGGVNHAKIQIVDPVAETIPLRNSYLESGSTRTQINFMAHHGGFIYCTGGITYPGTNRNDTLRGLVMKLDATDLSIVWQKKFSTGRSAVDIAANGFMAIDDQGSIYLLNGVTPWTEAGTVTSLPDLSNNWVIQKYNSSGDLVWSKVYRVSFPNTNIHGDLNFFMRSWANTMEWKNGKLYLAFSTQSYDASSNITQHENPSVMVIDSLAGECLWSQSFLVPDGVKMGSATGVNLMVDGEDVVLVYTVMGNFQKVMTMRLPAGAGKVIGTQTGMEQHYFGETTILPSITPTVTVTDFPILNETSDVSVTPETGTTQVTSLVSLGSVTNAPAKWSTYLSPLR